MFVGSFNFLYPRSTRGGDILFYLLPSVHPRYFYLTLAVMEILKFYFF